MRKPLFFLAALLAVRVSAALPFPQDSSDLRPDPAAHFGTLPNGLRYVILPNHEPRDRVSLRLLVLAGSIDEADDERGLAHYLEHMAFNGSTHFAPDTLVKYFQRMGMRMGADANASTSFLRTLYQLDLPDHRPETLAQGFQVFADYAGGLLLQPAMVDKERPIILAEKRTADSIGFRQFVASFKFLLSDSLFSRRITIGEKSDIDAATREKFVQIYNAWYRPERMAVIVVGDIDPAIVEPQVISAFQDLAPRAPAPAEPDLGHVATALGLRTFYQHEAEAPVTYVSIDVMAPYVFRPDSSELRKNHLIRSLATAMLNRRLSVLAKKEGAPFLAERVAIREQFNFYRDASVDLACAPSRWQEAFAVGEQELRRALQFGFTSAELREAVADERSSYREAAARAGTRLSNNLAVRIAEDLLDRRVFTSPADDYAWAGPILDRVTAEDCAAALRYAFATPGRYLMVFGNADIPGDASAAIVSAYQASQAVAVGAPAAEKEMPFAYTDFGPAGQIAERTEIPDLGITLVRFANGVRVNLKKTAFEANQVRFSVRVGAGQLLVPPTLPGMAYFTDLTFSAGGLGQHSSDDLRRITAGRAVQGRFAVENDAVQWTYATNQADLLFTLQLIAAHITDPGYRPEALRVAKKTISAVYNQLHHEAAGPLNIEVPRLLASGDTRFGLPSRGVELSRTIEEEKAWLAPQLSTGSIEVGMVGDLDVDAALAAVARTLGALPARSPRPDYRAERQVHFPAETFEKDFSVPTKIPKATLEISWPTEDIWNAPRLRRLQLLAAVLGDRLRIKIREKMGDAYGVSTREVSSDTYSGYGRIAVMTVVAPDRADEALAAILAVAADLQSGGVTEEELDRAKKPLLASLTDSVRTNQYWLNQVLIDCQEYPQRLEWARTRTADTSAITAADLAALAKTYLPPSRAFRIVVRPAAPSPGGGEGP